MPHQELQSLVSSHNYHIALYSKKQISFDTDRVSSLGHDYIHDVEADELYNLTKVIPIFSGRCNGVFVLCILFFMDTLPIPQYELVMNCYDRLRRCPM